MSLLGNETDPSAVVQRLRAVTNEHDIDAIVACFASDYRNETPTHSARKFVGTTRCDVTGRRSWQRYLTSRLRSLPRRYRATWCGPSGSIAARGGTAPRI